MHKQNVHKVLVMLLIHYFSKLLVCYNQGIIFNQVCHLHHFHDVLIITSYSIPFFIIIDLL